MWKELALAYLFRKWVLLDRDRYGVAHVPEESPSEHDAAPVVQDEPSEPEPQR